MDYVVHKKVLGEIDPKLIKLLDGIAAQTFPAFCHHEKSKPLVAFSIKKTAATGDGFFDAYNSSSIVYTTNPAFFPDKPINYLDWFIGGIEDHTHIAPRPSFAGDSMIIPNKFFTLFIECADVSLFDRTDNGLYARKKEAGKEPTPYEYCLHDRVKLCLVNDLLLSDDYTLATATLSGLHPRALVKLGRDVANLQDSFRSMTGRYSS